MPPQRMSLPSNVRRFLREVAPLSKEAKRAPPTAPFEALVRGVEVVPVYSELPVVELRRLLEQVASLAGSSFEGKGQDLDSRIYLMHALSRVCQSLFATSTDLDTCIELLQLNFGRRLSSTAVMAKHTIQALKSVAENPNATAWVEANVVRLLASLTDKTCSSGECFVAAVAALRAVVEHPASSFAVLRQVADEFQRMCSGRSRAARGEVGAARDPLAERLVLRLTSNESLVAFGPAGLALAVRMLVWETTRPRSSGAGSLACPWLLRALAAAPSPVDGAAPALERAGLSRELLAIVGSFAREPATEEAVWICADPALSSRYYDDAEIADGLLAAVCAPVEEVGVQAALAFKFVMQRFTRPPALQDATLETAARCLAGRAANTFVNQSIAVLQAVACAPGRGRAQRGIDTLCTALEAQGDIVFSRHAAMAAIYRSHLAEVCGGEGVASS